jgi:hypothetical protein
MAELASARRQRDVRRKPLKRLIDLPGMADLERAALMNPRYGDDDAREHFPDIDQCSTAIFGLTADEADQAERPAGWDGIETKPIRDQVAAFEREGWDVTDKRRPLRTLAHFNVQLWLALRGVAGKLPSAPVEDEDHPKDWAASLKADATRFKRDRR